MVLDPKKPIVENGIVVGTSSGKYETKNPIGRYLLNGFDKAVSDLASSVSPISILEIGCGEGHVTKLLLEATDANIQAMDISDTVLDMARRAVANSRRVAFENCNICAIDSNKHQVELIVCCEMLEHLENPNEGLEKLASIAAPYILLSVPREPIFKAMNFARGAYFLQFGNSPGHLQHWSKKEFLHFVAQAFDITEIRSPLPWTVILGRSKNHS